jgi:hypothetical protein
VKTVGGWFKLAEREVKKQKAAADAKEQADGKRGPQKRKLPVGQFEEWRRMKVIFEDLALISAEPSQFVFFLLGTSARSGDRGCSFHEPTRSWCCAFVYTDGSVFFLLYLVLSCMHASFHFLFFCCSWIGSPHLPQIRRQVEAQQVVVSKVC